MAEEEQQRLLQAQREFCESNIDAALQTNQRIARIVESIESLGCKVPRSMFACKSCDRSTSGGLAFDDHRPRDYIPQVVICHNKNIDRVTFENTIVHELVHAFDMCRTKKFGTNPETIACTEIRAASLSGECNVEQELLRGRVQLSKGHSDCVRRRAELSLAGQSFKVS